MIVDHVQDPVGNFVHPQAVIGEQCVCLDIDSTRLHSAGAWISALHRVHSARFDRKRFYN